MAARRLFQEVLVGESEPKEAGDDAQYSPSPGGKGVGTGRKGKTGKRVTKPKVAPPAPPTVVLTYPAQDLDPCLSAESMQVAQGLRAWACISLRAHMSWAGTVLRNKRRPQVTPLSGAVPKAVVLTRHGVAHLLERAVLLGEQRAVEADTAGDAAAAVAARVMATQTMLVLTALKAHPHRAHELGVTPLFNVGHPSLAALLTKHRVDHVPGDVVFTGRGLRVTFQIVRFVRRMERRGAEVVPGRLFNWRPKGNAVFRHGGPRGKNGAGLRTLSRNWKDWRCGCPGPYHPEGVMKRWEPWWDDAACVVIDPGVLLPLCCADGRVLSKDQWYRHRKVWADFVPKPPEVRQAEAGMAKVAGEARAPGLISFMAYVKEFNRVHVDALLPYYSSPSLLGAREHKGDKLRSLLGQLLHELAPRPQVRLYVCVCRARSPSAPWC